jgi:CheY-like chemotaxis protein
MNVHTSPILVVEDILDILRLLEETLCSKGYPVITASNGLEALEQAAKEHPALVITDILMPKMDGYALAQKLRINPQTSNIPIIFLSATYISPEDRDFALSLGAVRFMEKPVDPDEFCLTVAEVLQGLPPMSEPLQEQMFFTGYRERLESKLRQKNTQIARIERLLQALPVDQKPAFEPMLLETRRHCQEVEEEINKLSKPVDTTKSNP